jgi:Homing endonuclease associated repeat
MIRPEKRNLKWTSEHVLAEIRAWQDRGEPLYANHVRLNYQELLAASIRYFGSWQKAVETAGIPYEQVRKYRKWSQETIIQEIRNLHAQGVDLSFRAMALSQYNSMVYAAIRPKYFGSWKTALEAAGLEAQEIYRYRSWEETDILEEIRRLHAEGADLSSKAMDESSNRLIATARRRFGNWGRALEKAGVNYDRIRRRKRWTRESLVHGILELKRQGVPLITPEVKRVNPSLFAAACKKHFFGTWKKALKAALRSEQTEPASVPVAPEGLIPA